MRPDVVDLQSFYQSRLGLAARRLIRRSLRRLWPDVAGQTVLGLGFAAPYLRAFREEAERTLAVMPASQGVIAWPVHEPRLVALSEEADIPLPDESVDRVLLVHALEFSDETGAFLREVWRVMNAGGRMIALVPNRAGIWARTERTPWGQGQPFTLAQLTGLLREQMFTPMAQGSALFVPPTRSRLLLRFGQPLEGLCQRLNPPLGGVILIEAAKQVYAVRPERATKLRRRLYLPIPGGGVPAGARFAPLKDALLTACGPTSRA